MAPYREQFQPEDFFKYKTPEEQLRFLLHFAVLAPSPFNTQPWLFRLRGFVLEVWANEKRKLRAYDATGRQMFVSIGCLIQNLLVAADYYGWPAAIELFPDPKQPMFAARLTFKDAHYIENRIDHMPHLFFAIAERSSNYYSFAAKAVPEEFLKQLAKFNTEDVKIFAVTDEALRGKLALIAGKATEDAFSNPEIRQELSEWIRANIEDYRDGISGKKLGISLLLPWLAPFFVKNFSQGKQQRAVVERALLASSVSIAICTKTDNPADWLAAGMLYEHIALMAHAEHMAVGMITAPIQLDGYYRELQDVVSSVFRPQVFLRLGYPTRVAPLSPRLSLDQVTAK